jgi:hypothetical protein
MMLRTSKHTKLPNKKLASVWREQIIIAGDSEGSWGASIGRLGFHAIQTRLDYQERYLGVGSLLRGR